MARPEVVEYVREQLKAGYSLQEITSALLAQGWGQQEINESLSLIPPQPSVYPPVKIKNGLNSGFIISVIGGLMLFIFGLETALDLPLLSAGIEGAGLAVKLLGVLQAPLGSSTNIGAMILIFSIAVILGSFLLSTEGRSRLGALIVVVFSFFTLVSFHGFLVLIGGVLGIAGGIIGLRKG